MDSACRHTLHQGRSSLLFCQLLPTIHVFMRTVLRQSIKCRSLFLALFFYFKTPPISRLRLLSLSSFPAFSFRLRTRFFLLYSPLASHILKLIQQEPTQIQGLDLALPHRLAAVPLPSPDRDKTALHLPARFQRLCPPGAKDKVVTFPFTKTPRLACATRTPFIVR